MKEMNRQQGVTIVCSTHDHKMLATRDRILWINDGRIDIDVLEDHDAP